MRIDHHAYQRATRVASFGFFVQLAIGLILLIFGLIAPTGIVDEVPLRGDTPFYFAALFTLFGLPIWLTLIVVFHQHKLERLEALEYDEIHGDSLFTEDESRVAARRLRIMHGWLVPIISIVGAAMLAFLAWRIWGRMDRSVSDDPNLFIVTDARGWAIAICLAVTLVSFIFSRYVAGMAQQSAWANLKSGAAYLVANALVMLGIALGVAFRFFDQDVAIRVVSRGIAVLALIVAGEFVFNFILNLYRPRIPGSIPKPAFESRLLGFFAAPDSLVRSINEAVNYQFGFDIASSWGYQLLVRSLAWLLGFGVVVLFMLSMITVVEPNEQAVRLRGGAQIGEIKESGLMFKRPWPLETVETYDVTRIRKLPLTAFRTTRKDINLWGDKLKDITNIDPEPFLVGVAQVSDVTSGAAMAGGDDGVSSTFSLLEAEIFIEFRIKQDPSAGLSQYLAFAPDTVIRTQRMTMRELALRSIASAEVVRYLSTLGLDEILAAKRPELSATLRGRVQSAFDREKTGIEVIAVSLPVLRPPFDLTERFEDVMFAKQERMRRVDEANERVSMGLSAQVGDLDVADAIYRAILDWEDLAEEAGANSDAATAKRLEIKRMIESAGGMIAARLAEAEKERWVTQIEELTRLRNYQGEIIAFRAAPELYREREIMDIIARTLSGKEKYILGVDSQVNVDIDLNQTSSVFDASRSQSREGQ